MKTHLLTFILGAVISYAITLAASKEQSTLLAEPPAEHFTQRTTNPYKCDNNNGKQTTIHTDYLSQLKRDPNTGKEDSANRSNKTEKSRLNDIKKGHFDALWDSNTPFNHQEILAIVDYISGNLQSDDIWQAVDLLSQQQSLNTDLVSQAIQEQLLNSGDTQAKNIAYKILAAIAHKGSSENSNNELLSVIKNEALTDLYLASNPETITGVLNYFSELSNNDPQISHEIALKASELLTHEDENIQAAAFSAYAAQANLQDTYSKIDQAFSGEGSSVKVRMKALESLSLMGPIEGDEMLYNKIRAVVEDESANLELRQKAIEILLNREVDA